MSRSPLLCLLCAVNGYCARLAFDAASQPICSNAEDLAFNFFLGGKMAFSSLTLKLSFWAQPCIWSQKKHPRTLSFSNATFLPLLGET